MPTTPRQPLPPLPGDLLIAAVGEPDSVFTGTVVLMLECEDEGAVGVVINRYAEVEVDEVLPGWEAVLTPPQAMFWGGPVSSDAALCLGRREGPGPASWQPVFGDVGLVSLDEDPAVAGSLLRDARIFGGFCGWGPGQLAAEIEAGGWYVVAGTADDLFSPTPELLWRSVLRRSPGEAAFFSTWTEHPERN